MVVNWTGLVYYVILLFILLFLLMYLVYRVCRFFTRNREMQHRYEERVLRRLDELLEVNREFLKHYKKDNS